MIKTQNKTATIQLRIDPKLKEKARRIFKRSNMDMSLAISAMLTEVVKRDGPLIEMRTVNGYTPKREKEILSRIQKAKLSPVYKDINSFLDALEN